MEDRNLNIDLDELFRKKLESSELVPGKMAGKSLMRRLARREFVRFNPARFNIYYLGGIVAAGIAATLIISSGPDKIIEKEIIPSKEEIVVPEKPAGITGNYEEQAKNTGKTEQVTVNEGSQQKKSDNNNNKGVQTVVMKHENIAKGVEGTLSYDSLHKATIIKDQQVNDNLKEATILKNLYADFNTSVSSGCIPLKVKFINRSNSFDSCVWIFNDGRFSGTRDVEWIFDKAGEYNVTLKIFGADGSESESTETITVYPKPVVRFETYPQNPILPDDAISFINYSRDAVKYHWDFGDGSNSDAFEPEHRYSRYSSYNVKLIAWNQYGCSDTLMLKNAFPVSGNYMDFPNAFIPNPDGPAGGYYSTKSDETAQIFHPFTSGVSEYQLSIFSKTGVLIFESNDINFGWDGYNKGKLCEPGVYVWKARGTFKNGETFVKMGDVTIIRN